MTRCLAAVVTMLVIGSAIIGSQSNAVRPTAAVITAPLRAFGAIHPRISPDGETIAFSYQGAIWTMSRAGGVMRRLTSGTGIDVEPAWSADGKMIAFINGANFAGGELQLTDAANGAALPVPAGVKARDKLFLHPEGEQVLGTFQLPNQPEGLAWYHLRTGVYQPVLVPPQVVRQVSLSPDGTQIAYATTVDVPGQQTGNDGPQNDLWIVSASGGKPEKLTRFPSRIHDTCWAGRDRALIVTSDRGGVHYDLWRVPLDDPERGPRKITLGFADEDRPSVSRDGRWLVYTDNREQCTALVVRDLTTGNEQTLSPNGMDFGGATGTLHLETVQQGTNQPLVARVALEQMSGKAAAPPGTLYRMSNGVLHYYCRGQSALTLPAGEYRLRAFHGPEYKMTEQRVRIAAGETARQVVPLERWTDQPAAGWHSGENHIHANYGYGHWYNTPETMLDQCEGEDLHVCNFMVANSDSDGVFDREFFRGTPDPLSAPRTILSWNQEFRSTLWGHMTLVNLTRVVEPVFTGFKDTTNPFDSPTNADIAEKTRLQQGIVNYTHPAQNVQDPYLGPYTAKGIAVDVALGRIDTLDVNGGYAATVPLWQRLLNCGFRLTASAGTDCFLNRINSRLPGTDRAYVKIEGPFSYASWISGLRAGRSFVTNGPMLRLAVGNKELGDTLRLDGSTKVRVQAEATSQFALNRVELIHNGRVVATGKMSDDNRKGTIDETVELSNSGWMMLAVGGQPHVEGPGGPLAAFTSPIYIDIPGRPVPSAEDARFFLAWIDRLEAAFRERNRVPSDAHREQVLAQLNAARAVYRRLAQ